jgi:hypothetical protein
VNAPIVTTRGRWFIRGFAVGILIAASLNAVSYFFRSEWGGNLVGTRPTHYESLGFPWQLWESGNTYGGLFIDPLGLLANGAVAIVLGSVGGLAALRYRSIFNRLVEEWERVVAEQQRRSVQFSLRSLLAAMGLAALLAAGTRYALAGRAEVLGAIYLLGPWVLVAIAFLPLGMTWQQRVYVLLPAALLLMAAAVALGLSLKPKVEFDKVLLGFFICWTPQSALAALVLSAAIVARHVRATRHNADTANK